MPEPMRADIPRPPAARPGLLRAGGALLRRDLRLVWRRRGDALQPLLFAVLVIALFPLAVGADPAQLVPIAPAVLWVAALLAGLSSLDALYRGDADDGSLEQLMLAPVPLAWLVAVRVFAHWLTTAVPLLLAMPLLAQMMQLPGNLLGPLMVSLALGTPLLSLVGSVVAALTVGMRRSGMILALLALPLYVPILVFGAGSVIAAAQGLDWTGGLLLLAAGLVLGLLLAPLAAATAIRIALS